MTRFFALLTISAFLLGVWSPFRLVRAFAQNSPDGVATTKTVVQLDYQAPDDCPQAAGFAQGVHRRTHRLVVEERASAILTIRLRRDGELIRGSVEQPERELYRVVTAQHCEDAVLALTLITVIAFDPEADMSVEPPPSDRENDQPATASEAINESSPEPSPKREPSPPALPEHESVEPPAWHLGAGPLGQVGDHAGVGLGGEIAVWSTRKNRQWDAVLGVQVSRSSRSTALGSSDFWQLNVDLAWCPSIAWDQLRLGPCAGARAGAMLAQARDSATLDAVPRDVRPQLAPWLGLFSRWAVGKQWSLAPRLEVAFPVLRHRYTVESLAGNRQALLQQQPFAFAVNLGVLYEL